MKMDRKKIFNAALFVGAACSAPTPGVAQESGEPLNIMFIVADDLNCSTTPMFGCKVPDLMPNIERLSREGMLFRRAHVVSAASQVSRGGIMTGLYPHNSGIDGFYHTDREEIPTVQETFRANGYRIGIICKLAHSTPKASIHWDMEIEGPAAHQGRDPQVYYDNVVKFIRQCQAEGKPFFFMANSIDPHRPFAGSEQERQKMGANHSYPDPGRIYRPEEIEVPGFVPDIPEVRREAAQYYSSVHRLDESVGAVLKALHDTGADQNTVIFFISDNGMSMPFSKTCSYLHSTHTPLIVRWPGVTKPGSEDDAHFVCGIDFMPTFFEIAGIPVPEGLDGRSFLPVLKGEQQSGREYVYTEFTENSGRMREPMRAVQNEKFGYIYNPWSNGVREFKSETMAGLTFNAMCAAAETDPEIRARVELFRHRVPEEFYDYENDPDAKHNLIDDPAYQEQIAHFRQLLEANMEKTNDPVLEPFRHRDDPAVVEEYMRQQGEIVKARLQKQRAANPGKWKGKKKHKMSNPNE